MRGGKGDAAAERSARRGGSSPATRSSAQRACRAAPAGDVERTAARAYSSDSLHSKAIPLDPNPLPFLSKSRPEDFIALALKEARKASEAGEVPVGAVIVDIPSGRVIARAHNQRELLQDPTAHAEVIAITQAASHYASWRLTEAALFVTLEPCLMCAGAIVQARIPRVYYGADDEKAGAYRSVFQVLVHPGNNHLPEVTGGVRAGECGDVLREFFRRKRLKPTNGGGSLETDPPA